MIRRLGRPAGRQHDDEGAILIIAILLVTVVALVTGFVLTRGDGSLRASVALREVAGGAYAADGAAQVAINALRTGYSPADPNGARPDGEWAFNNSVDGTGCFGMDASGNAVHTLVLPSFYPATGRQGAATSAAVECVAEDATGARGSPVPITNGNKPGNAILTLGTSGEPGFRFKTNGSGAAFRVRGGIWSNADIVRDNNGDLESTEYIRAHTGCSPASAMVAPVVNCGANTAPDPGYRSDLDLSGAGIPPLHPSLPASCPNNSTVTLQPGYYDDVTKLNALTTSNTTCTIHLTPGTYYFDFHNNSSDPLFDSDIASGSGNVWTIGSRKTLVAGTLTGDPTVPGRCVNPIDDVNANGVQLIFGGDSRLVVDAAGQPSNVEICGSYHTQRPPIAIYGQKEGVATPTAIGPAAALTATAVTNVTPSTFTGATVPHLVAADGVQATSTNLAEWTRDNTGSNNVQNGSITMTGFAPVTTLPRGTVLTGARLKVTHRSTGSQSQLTFIPNLGPTPITYTLPVRTNLGTEDVDLSQRPGWGALQKQVHDQGFSGGQVLFTAGLGKNQVAQLDAVRLELTYYVPRLRGQTTAAVPGNTVATVGGAPVIKTSGNATSFYVQGTTYTPLASIDLELNNAQESVFRFGVIARSLDVFETGSFTYTGPVIELPDNSPGWGVSGTLVQLKVYVCPEQPTCGTDGTPALKLRVQLWDPSGNPDPPRRQVSVLSWSHDR